MSIYCLYSGDESNVIVNHGSNEGNQDFINLPLCLFWPYKSIDNNSNPTHTLNTTSGPLIRPYIVVISFAIEIQYWDSLERLISPWSLNYVLLRSVLLLVRCNNWARTIRPELGNREVLLDSWLSTAEAYLIHLLVLENNTITVISLQAAIEQTILENVWR